MLKLVKLSHEYKKQLFEMMDEWISVEEKIIPWSIVKNDYRDFDNYLKNLELSQASEGLVPDSTFFALDIDRNIFVGAVNIRHYLNEALLKSGGHIGDGIRPSERGKGYGTLMVELALDECRKLGMCEVLMVCHKDNIASKKTIINNGGVLDNIVSDSSGRKMERYWINLEIPKNKILMPELLEKFNDCDSFSLTCREISFEWTKEDYKKFLLTKYNELEDKSLLPTFEELYLEVEEECKKCRRNHCDIRDIENKYKEPKAFFDLFYLFVDNACYESVISKSLISKKNPVDRLKSDTLKSNLIRYEILNYNHCTISAGPMINYYFRLNNKSKKWLLQFRSDFHLSGSLDDLAFYKNNKLMFSSCTHEFFNSLGESI